MPKYQNVGFESGKSQFIDATTNVVGPNAIIFTNATKLAPLAGGAKASMVSGTATVNLPVKVDSGDTATGTVLNESIKIQWNFSRGDIAKFAALRAEMDRLLDKAVLDYNLTQGLVPPVYATFETI